MTDKEMLMMTYGVLKSHEGETSDAIIQMLEDHLWPETKDQPSQTPTIDALTKPIRYGKEI